MKLNPFNKKQKNSNPTRYDELCAQFVDLDAQLVAAKQALDDAETDHATKAKEYHALESRSNSTMWSLQEQSLFGEAARARQHEDECRRIHNQLSTEHRKLRWRVEAPSVLKRDKSELKALVERQSLLQRDLTKARTRRTQLQERVDALNAEIDAERQAAAQALIDSEEEHPAVVLPVRQAEHEVLASALEQLGTRMGEMEDELAAIPDRIRKARHAIHCGQAHLAEIELEESLPKFIDVIARYTVAQHRAGWGRDSDRHEIEVPHAVQEMARARLNAEMNA